MFPDFPSFIPFPMYQLEPVERGYYVTPQGKRINTHKRGWRKRGRGYTKPLSGKKKHKNK